VNAPGTARALARERLTAEITDAALRQVAAEGASSLSLRAVTRELGMASSAIYRYFPSRDDLLTTLIIDSYRALGDAAAAATEPLPADDHLARWRAAAHALRDWALAHPHQFHLVYGSPVPGYAAPTDTVEAATHAVGALVRVVGDAERAGALDPPTDRPLEEPLSREAARVAHDLLDDLPAATTVALFQAFGQLIGIVTLELNGQLVGSFTPADALWARTVDETADRLGLSG